MIEFTKIYAPYRRFTEGPQRNKLDRYSYISDEIRVLSPLAWHWTEKIDGTNIRVHWDGHRVAFGGRTNNAQIPTSLLTVLQESFHEELLEQTFQHQPATLFGEGCGAGIQKGGGNYFSSPNFLLFDVYIPDPRHNVGGWWLKWEDVVGVAKSLGVSTVPFVGEFGLITAVQTVEDGLKSTFGDFIAEGLVGRVPFGLLDRGGRRLLVKVKTKDFCD